MLDILKSEGNFVIKLVFVLSLTSRHFSRGGSCQGWRKMLNSSGATSNFWRLPNPPPPPPKNLYCVLQLNLILTNEDNRILESINRTI